MALSPSDYVGWTVTVHENNENCPTGVFYCVGLWNDDLQLAKHGGPRQANDKCELFINYWVSPKFCTRLRQGDFAP